MKIYPLRTINSRLRGLRKASNFGKSVQTGTTKGDSDFLTEHPLGIPFFVWEDAVWRPFLWGESLLDLVLRMITVCGCSKISQTAYKNVCFYYYSIIPKKKFIQCVFHFKIVMCLLVKFLISFNNSQTGLSSREKVRRCSIEGKPEKGKQRYG